MGNIKIESRKLNFREVESEEKKQAKILLIMEFKNLKEKTLNCLNTIDCEFVDYVNFENTVSALMKNEFDLVLLDSDCAKLKAFEFLRILYERRIKVPIILYCSEDNAKQKQEALRHGVFDFAKKPLDPILFESTVRLALVNGRDFINKMSTDFFEKGNSEKVELSLDKRVLAQIDKACVEMNISRETFLQKAIQKVLAKEERTNDPSAFWSPKIVTGIGWIDDQHYLLLMQIQEIYNLYSESNDVANIGDVFKFLKHYVDVHFMQEEQMFYVLSAEERDEHLRQHEHFKVKILELNHELQIENNEKVILELSLYCQKWFINHIRLIDQNLVVKIKEVTSQESA